MARTARTVLLLAVFAAIGVIMLGPIVDTVNGNTGTQSVTNETVTADYNNSFDLTGYQIDASSVTVYGYNDTSSSYETAPSGDYSVNTGPGTIEFNNSSTLIQDGEDVKVTYDYQSTNETTTLVLGFLPVGVGVLIFAVVAQRVQGVM